eukprot:Rhum_TRINITY_DN23149_c0_g1::Rhum_TRINITY_DN23149_c0_g1_i1::g.177257::m.177257
MVKIKKGFKVDRAKARRDPAQLRKGKRAVDAKKNSKVEASTAPTPASARPKVIKFNTDQMKDYITGFHVRKNQRRMYAIKKAKDDHRAQVNSERKDRREERRKIFNQISQFQINEDYKLEMPGTGSDDEAADDDDESSEDESDDADSDEGDADGVDRVTYAGANDDTQVDIEVGELDLGIVGGASSASRSAPDQARRRPRPAGGAASGGGGFPSSDAAFPGTEAAAPTRVRLIRRRR